MNGVDLADDGFFCELNGIRHFVRTARPADAWRVASNNAGDGRASAEEVPGAPCPRLSSASHPSAAGAPCPGAPGALPRTAASAPTPLVLLHGFMQDSRAWSAELLEELGRDRPVYALDFAGFGRSATPEGALAYRVEETVA